MSLVVCCSALSAPTPGQCAATPLHAMCDSCSLQHWALISPDQGSQYGSDEWLRFCRLHNLMPSVSHRGNCYDNAVAESFFSCQKKERIRRKVYKTRDDARPAIFDYIEVFYTRTRRHSHRGGISPDAFEMAACAAAQVSTILWEVHWQVNQSRKNRVFYV